MGTTYLNRRPALAAALAVAVGLAGCSLGGDKEAARAAETRLSRAATAIDIADTRETRRFAASELAIAREKLAAARDAAGAAAFGEADRLIAEAMVNIQLATARADAARRRAALERMKASPPAAGEEGQTQQ